MSGDVPPTIGDVPSFVNFRHHSPDVLTPSKTSALDGAGGNWLPDGRWGVYRNCLRCRARFLGRADRDLKFCSQDCHHAATKAKTFRAASKFIHQDGDKRKKLRANGLINKRIKLGLIKRPKCCEMCGTPGRVDACHIDYDLPDVVTFACRSCHMRSHYDPAVHERLKSLAKSRGGPVEKRLSNVFREEQHRIAMGEKFVADLLPLPSREGVGR